MPISGYLSIAIYAILFAFCTFSSRVAERQAAECGALTENRRAKMPVWLLLAYALLFTLYNVFCTESSAFSMAGGDRTNYAYDFTYGTTRSLSTGLSVVYDIVRLCGGNIETVFYVSTFVCCALTFWAYRLSDDASAPVIPLLLCSEFVFFTFTALKQCYACAFASLFFVLMMRPRTVANTGAALLLVVLACLFHTAGFVLVPLFFLLLVREKKDMSFLIIGVCLVGVIFFLPWIATLLESIVQPFLPTLAGKIRYYFDVLNSEPNGGSSFTFLKWIPFYFITAWGFFRRRVFRPLIAHYDAYLVISCVASAAALCSFTSYWFYRFLYLFFLPVFIFYNLMAAQCEDRRGPDILVYGGLGFLLLRFLVQIYVYYGGF